MLITLKNYFGTSNISLLFVSISLLIAIIVFFCQSFFYNKEEKRFQMIAPILREAYYKNHFTRKKSIFFSAFAILIFITSSIFAALTPYPIMRVYPIHTIFLFNAWRLFLPLAISFSILALILDVFMRKRIHHLIKLQEILNEKE